MAAGERREPLDVRCMRELLRRWPFRRGRRMMARLFQLGLGRRNVLMEVEPGVWIPPELDDTIVFWCFADGSESWEPVMHLSRDLIRAGDTVFDVGANIGIWVMGSALRAGPSGQVHAFEPVPDNLARLQRNLAINGLSEVTCSPLALSDRAGTATFFAATNGNSALGSLASHSGVDRAIGVALTTLDAYCDERAIARIDFIKVDVEGAEALVFRGGERRLGAVDAPAIMFEADDRLTASFDASTAGVKQWLREHGYEVYRHRVGALEVVPVAEAHRGEDLLALKPFHFERHPVLRRLARM